MKLTLLINNEKKEFTQPSFIPALVFKEAIILSEELQNDMKVETLDKTIEFVSSKLYNNGFTVEEFWNGIDIGDLLPILGEALNSPMNRISGVLDKQKN